MAKPTIVTRAGKGSALTWTEGDANLTNLRDATITVQAGTGGTNVVSDLNGTVTLVAGTNITLSGDNTAKTVTISSSGGTGITDVVQDTTPQLGGDLDVNGFAIVSASNGNIAITPNGTGSVVVDGNALPQDQGTADQVLITDGAGQTSWSEVKTVHALVYNADSVTINKGQPVYLFGANGANPSVKLALNTSDTTSAKTYGLAAEEITAGSTGRVVTQGILKNVDTSTYAAGDTLYLGSTAGSMTTTKPYAPNHLVYLGTVTTVNSTSGRIIVRVQNGYELDEIHDVQITSTPSDGQVLAYEASSSLWKPRTNNLDGLSDVVITAAANGKLLQHNGTNWVDVNASSVNVGSADSATLATTATNANNVALTADNSTNATNYLLFANSATGNAAARTDTGLTYNPSTNTLTATTFSGALSGNASTASKLSNMPTMGYTTTATAGGTTTLTSSSNWYQVFTGSSNQTVVLPATDTLAVGWTFYIVNNSTGTLTIQANGGVSPAPQTIPAGTGVMCTVLDTTAGNPQSTKWECGLTNFSAFTGTGSVVLGTSPTLTTPNLGTPSAIVLTNASGTASININGTVGATTANTGAFTTLSATTTTTSQALSVTYNPSTTSGAAIQATGKDSQGGVGYFDFLKTTNTTTGATNANKSFRTNSTGALEIINSAYTGTILSLTDAGLLTAPSFTSSSTLTFKEPREAVFDNGNSGAATITPNAANGSVQKYTLTGNITWNAFGTPVAGQSMTMILVQDATGSRTLTSTMKWAGGTKTLSTAANSTDIVTVYYDGTNYYASLAKGFA